MDYPDWNDLPNAKRIDNIMSAMMRDSLRFYRIKELTVDIKASAFDDAYNAAWEIVFAKGRDFELSVVEGAFDILVEEEIITASHTNFVSRVVNGAAAALIAWDDSVSLLDAPLEKVKSLAKGGDTVATLLFPIVVLKSIYTKGEI